MVNMLAQLSWPQTLLALVIIAVCVLLMIVILLQRGRGGGLSGAFGGGGGSAAFGAKTGDVFTWITVGFTTVFVLLTVVANFAFDESASPPAASKPSPAVEVIPDGAAPPIAVEGSDVKIEMGGEPVTTEDGKQLLPIRVAPPDSAPTTTGAPSVPEKHDGDGTDTAEDDSESDHKTDDDGSGG